MRSLDLWTIDEFLNRLSSRQMLGLIHWLLLLSGMFSPRTIWMWNEEMEETSRDEYLLITMIWISIVVL